MAARKLDVQPIRPPASYRAQTYRALKRAIGALDIYGQPDEIRLDEQRLADELQVSRTPVRAAMAQLEQEGIVRAAWRRGMFVVRKTRREIVEMIQAWAALEGLAARRMASVASDGEIGQLREIFDPFIEDGPDADLHAYSDANLRFHQALIRLGRSGVIDGLTENLLTHVRAVRRLTIGQRGRAARSCDDHLRIIEALERRDGARAERLACRHTLGLADHVERHCDFLN